MCFPGVSREMSNEHNDWCVVDFCCGLGGLSLAASQLGMRILGGVDLADSALSSFTMNFPDASVIQGSITSRKIRQAAANLLDDLPKRHKSILVSGPPCQGFSAAGPRQKMDPRNRVLSAVANAVSELQPDAALIENVATLLADRHRHTLNRFRRKIERAGYDVVILKLNAADFGVPQRRHRVFCFASKREVSAEYLQRQLHSQKRPQKVVHEAFEGLPIPIVYNGSSSLEDAVPSSHVAMRHSTSVRKKIAAIPVGKGPMSYRKLDPNTVSRTLVSGNRAPPAHYSEPRSITPREAARLQGFPDSFRFNCVFSKQLLHVTNAVPPPMAKAAIAALVACHKGTPHVKR